MSWFSRRNSPPAVGVQESTTEAQLVDLKKNSLLLVIEDVFAVTRRGVVVTGRIVAGSVTVNQWVTARRSWADDARFCVSGIEMFRKLLDSANQGDNVGLLLRGASSSDFRRGDELWG